MGRDRDALFPEDGGYSVPDSCFVYDDVEGRVDLFETVYEVEEEYGLELPVVLVGVRDDVGKDRGDVPVAAFQEGESRPVLLAGGVDGDYEGIERVRGMCGDYEGIEQLVGSGSPFVEVLAPDVRFISAGKDGLDFVGVGHRVVQDVDVDDAGGRLVGAVIVFSGTDAEDFLIHEALSFRPAGTDEVKLSVGGGQRGEHGGFHGHDVYFLRFVHDYL